MQPYPGCQGGGTRVLSTPLPPGAAQLAPPSPPAPAPPSRPPIASPLRCPTDRHAAGRRWLTPGPGAMQAPPPAAPVRRPGTAARTKLAREPP